MSSDEWPSEQERRMLPCVMPQGMLSDSTKRQSAAIGPPALGPLLPALAARPVRIGISAQVRTNTRQLWPAIRLCRFLPVIPITPASM